MDEKYRFKASFCTVIIVESTASWGWNSDRAPQCVGATAVAPVVAQRLQKIANGTQKNEAFFCVSSGSLFKESSFLYLLGNAGCV